LEAADILINVVVVGTCCRKLRANRIKEGKKREKREERKKKGGM
jgi:ribosomal protein L21